MYQSVHTSLQVAIAGLGAFYSYCGQLCHVFRPCIIQISPSALSLSTATAVSQGQPPAIANATHIVPTFNSYYVSINQYKVKQIWLSFLWYWQGHPEITTVLCREEVSSPAEAPEASWLGLRLLPDWERVPTLPAFLPGWWGISTVCLGMGTCTGGCLTKLYFLPFVVTY